MSEALVVAQFSLLDWISPKQAYSENSDFSLYFKRSKSIEAAPIIITTSQGTHHGQLQKRRYRRRVNRNDTAYAGRRRMQGGIK